MPRQTLKPKLNVLGNPRKCCSSRGPRLGGGAGEAGRSVAQSLGFERGVAAGVQDALDGGDGVARLHHVPQAVRRQDQRPVVPPARQQHHKLSAVVCRYSAPSVSCLPAEHVQA